MSLSESETSAMKPFFCELITSLPEVYTNISVNELTNDVFRTVPDTC